MLQKTVFFIITAFILSGCVTGPEAYLKRSANNKLFDTKGFHGGKRTPLHNKKYIAKAKRNIATDNLEDDDEELDEDALYEAENAAKVNMNIYRQMLERDLERKEKSSRKKRRKKGKAYPSLTKANKRLEDHESYDQTLELRDELEKVKAMLEETKRDLSSYKCPSVKQIESKQQKSKNQKLMEQDEQNMMPKIEPTIVEPVKSI